MASRRAAAPLKSLFPLDLEITATINLERELIRQFKGKCLEEAIPGKMVSNEYGDCYLITDECISEFRKVDYDNLAGFCKNENLAIIDIETSGLSFENPIILLGIANIRKNRVGTHQFLLRDISDELGAIWSFLFHVENGSSLITYNGRRFDIPYIKQRLSYYGKEASLNNPHFDILYFIWRTLGKRLPNCRLGTVEKYFGIQRGTNIPGALVPHFYDTYLKTRNVGPLVAIVEHNKRDLINLGAIVSRLYELRNPTVKVAQQLSVTHARTSKTSTWSTYPKDYFLNLLNLKRTSRYNSPAPDENSTWWERRANMQYHCSTCKRIIEKGEKYIGRRKLRPGRRGIYGYRGTYITDYYHIVCLLEKAKAEIEKNIRNSHSEINGIEKEITYFNEEMSLKRAQVENCRTIIRQVREDYERGGFWRKIGKWLGFRYTLWSKNNEISRLEKEMDHIENREIPERETQITSLKGRINNLKHHLTEIDTRIQELVSSQQSGH
jgi:uncharacterized protein YprB with RNaseH-like and TPR domain